MPSQLARRMGLPKCRHVSQDNMYEYMWVQHESRIRYDSLGIFRTPLIKQNHEYYLNT